MTLSPVSEEEAVELLLQAREAASNAYAPYSGFRVGAALVTATGKVFTGANVENAAYGSSVCAERVAAVKAVSAGEKIFRALAVVAADGGEISPCGDCRQVLYEFGPQTTIVTEGSGGRPLQETLADLLPRAFKS